MKKYSVTFTITLTDDAPHPEDWLQDNVFNCLESGESLEDFKVKRMIVVDEIQEFMDILTAT